MRHGWPAVRLASLRLVRELNPGRLLPGHGPIVEDPIALVDEYLAHRAQREQQILGAILAGAWEERLKPEAREAASVAATALAVADGAELLRVHDRSALDALRVAERIARPAATGA